MEREFLPQSTKQFFNLAKVISIKQIGEGIPLVDPSKAAWKYLQSLSKEDFQESALIFNEKKCIISKSH